MEMARDTGKAARAADVLGGVIVALPLPVFAVLSVCGMLGTCTIDAQNYSREHILFQRDFAWPNLGMLLLMVCLCAAALIFFGDRIGDGHIRVARAVLLVWTFGLSMLWMVSTQTLPTSDSYEIIKAAKGLAAGDFAIFHSELQYFQMFPFQLGLVAAYELILRVAGGLAYPAMFALNAVSLTLAYWALVVLTERLFAERRVTFLTIVFLALCLQPMLYTSFLYGSLPGLAAMLWAFVLLLGFLRNGRRINIVFVALLCALAVTLKRNYWIPVLALCIVLLISLLRRFRAAKLACLLAAVAAPLLLSYGVQTFYEQRADVTLGAGTPQTAWLVMGLSDSPRAPGWYNGYTYDVLKDADMDARQASDAILRDLAGRRAAFAEDGAYAREFFLKKTLSQWNEPSFESVWVSKAREHESPPPAYVQSVYEGTIGDILSFGFEHGVTYAYAMFALGLFAVLRRRFVKRAAGGLSAQTPPEFAALLPLTVFGAFVYHLLFEAKSQYVLVYLPMLLPYAAFGAVYAADIATRRRVRRGNFAV